MLKYFHDVHHCNMSCISNEGWTPLHSACLNGHLDIAKYLVDEKQCDPACTKNGGWTPLHLASHNGHLDIAKYLVDEKQCNPACTKNNGCTPLHIACSTGHLDVAKYLVDEKHCNPACTMNDGWTPLHSACKNGHLDIVKYLVDEKQCNSACTGNDGWTPLYSACGYGHLDLAKYLVDEKQCDPACSNDNGCTPLHMACATGHPDVAKYLVDENQCNFACTMKDGCMPLHLACQNGHLNVAKYLVDEKQCDPASTMNDGCTPLHLACQNGHLDIAQYLVDEKQCDPACTKNDGWTPLHSACFNGHLDIAKYLVDEKQCDPACTDNDGWTPLHAACSNGSVDAANYLVKVKHCDQNCRNNQRKTPLHLTCEKGSADLLKILITDQNCRCLTSVDILGQTPLFLSCLNGHFRACQILVEECKCSPLAISPVMMNSPLQLAKFSNQLDIFVLFLKNCVGKHKSFFQRGMFLNECIYGVALMGNKYDNEIISLLVTLCGIHFNPSIARRLVSPTVKLFILGNPKSGKSTLVATVKECIKQKSYFWKSSQVSEVAPDTAGINPVHVQSTDVGRVIMYDCAGHCEYYSSHAAILESFALSKGTMVIIMLNLTEDVDQLVKILEYWQSFVKNSAYVGSRGPPVLVMGSHSDVVASQGGNPAEKLSSVIKLLKKPLCCVGVDLNCTLLSSQGLDRLFNVLKEYRKHAFKNYEIGVEVHFLKIFVIKKHLRHCTACLASSMMHTILKREEFSLLRKCHLLPLTPDELSKSLITLSECGHLLFLKDNQDIMKSWIILKPLKLLSQINATIFAFPNSLTIFGDTGIVTLTKIKELFKYRHRMIINLMTHMEFCQQINDAEVLLINECLYSSVDPRSPEVYYFLPALIQKERHTTSCESITKTSYRCGWYLQCGEGMLSPRFLHVLLLRLHSNKILKLSAIHKEYNVWKNGVYWLNNDGVKAIIEVVEQNTAVVMVMGCLEGKEMNCVKHRSEVIKVILQTRKDFSPAVETEESLIHYEELSTYPVDNLDSVFKFSISRLATAVAEHKDVITGRVGSRLDMERIDKLLHFEPYVCFKKETIKKLMEEGNKDNEVSDVFLRDCARDAHPNLDKLKEILLLPEHDCEYITAVKEVPDQYSDDPTHKCFHVFKTWTKYAKDRTYKGLKEALDKYSIFYGRNPLDFVQ